MLIMNALSGNASLIHNLSNANDTELMRKLIDSADQLLDVEDAGTTMRFLTAYFAITGKQKSLTGTPRMKHRPVGILVEALRTLGARIEYLENEGFPPIRTMGFEGQKTNTIRIRGDVSSQYISALMMVAPMLPQGLTIELIGKVGSMPYIEMTASLMRKFGVEAEIGEGSIYVKNQSYNPCQYTVESDWSAASYWFAFAALAAEAEVRLPGIVLRSLQGDRVIVDIMEQLGVMAQPRGADLILLKKEGVDEIAWDFTHCPDLAQTVAVVCAAKGIKGTFTGLESLRIKETDRIHSLQTELAKIGAQLTESGNAWKLIPSTSIPEVLPVFNTYLDHRMAMAFAPLATIRNITIENPDVVRKSYPHFWSDMSKVGFTITSGAVD
jgi:3-phosphoshikimate 1-carboxyvinyltransferase